MGPDEGGQTCGASVASERAEERRAVAEVCQDLVVDCADLQSVLAADLRHRGQGNRRDGDKPNQNQVVVADLHRRRCAQASEGSQNTEEQAISNRRTSAVVRTPSREHCEEQRQEDERDTKAVDDDAAVSEHLLVLWHGSTVSAATRGNRRLPRAVRGTAMPYTGTSSGRRCCWTPATWHCWCPSRTSRLRSNAAYRRTTTREACSTRSMPASACSCPSRACSSSATRSTPSTAGLRALLRGGLLQLVATPLP